MDFVFVMYLEIDPEHIVYSDIQEVSNIIRGGGIAIVPTDSVYALVCALDQKESLLKLCKLVGKKPAQSNMSMLLSSITDIGLYTTPFSNSVFRMLKSYLPGPFTFILRANNTIPKMFLNKRKTVGIRVPNNAICQAILEQVGTPLASTSLKNEDEILEYFSDPYEIQVDWQTKVDVIVAGGNSIMEPSTIIDCTGVEPELIREGAGKLN